MVKKKLFYLLIIFCSFTLLVWGEKNILSILTNSQEPEPVFMPLRAGAAWKKIPGAVAAKKFAGSQALFWKKNCH